MARTFGGLLYYDASQINFTGTATYTRNAKGDISVNQGASLTVQYQMGLADVKRPYITFPADFGQGTVLTSNEFKELFGTAAGGPSNPFSGSAAGLAFEGTAAFPWGIALLDIFAVYSVAGAALTAATLGVSRQVYANNAAFTITDVVAPATTGKTATTTSASTPYIATLPLAQPILFESVDFSDLITELVLTTQVAGSARVYGMGCHVAVEYS